MFLCHLIIASTGKVDVSLNSDDNLKNEVQQLLFKMTKLGGSRRPEVDVKYK